MDSYARLAARERAALRGLERERTATARAREVYDGEPNARNLRAYRRARHGRRVAQVELDRARREVRQRTGSMLFVTTLDGTPIYRGLALMLQDARAHGATFRLTSADRRPGVAEAHGKMGQAQLFECAQAKLRTGRCPPGCHGNCNPANPPQRSSHAGFSDGSRVFAALGYGPGERLPWYMLGIDAWEDDGGVEKLVAVLRSLGYRAVETYKGAKGEAQHLNVLASPKPTLRRRGVIP